MDEFTEEYEEALRIITNWLKPVAHIALRDFFAGCALIGMLANDLQYGDVAKNAWSEADAMLAARTKGES